MNFRDYCHHRKAEEKLRSKPYRILAIVIFLPVAGFTFLILTKPVALLKTLSIATHRIGFPNAAADIHSRAELYEAERNVRQKLLDEPVWIELPITHREAFVRAYLDAFDTNASVVLFPSSKGKFKACVPRRLHKRLTLEALGTQP
ncbi:MAG: hypothetical protein RLZZ505_240 [Verrucomicrobiota bacterium]|jgi:hypothetical protein